MQLEKNRVVFIHPDVTHLVETWLKPQLEHPEYFDAELCPMRRRFCVFGPSEADAAEAVCAALDAGGVEFTMVEGDSKTGDRRKRKKATTSCVRVVRCGGGSCDYDSLLAKLAGSSDYYIFVTTLRPRQFPPAFQTLFAQGAGCIVLCDTPTQAERTLLYRDLVERFTEHTSSLGDVQVNLDDVDFLVDSSRDCTAEQIRAFMSAIFFDAVCRGVRGDPVEINRASVYRMIPYATDSSERRIVSANMVNLMAMYRAEAPGRATRTEDDVCVYSPPEQNKRAKIE